MKHSFEIDYIKGIAILMVIVFHSIMPYSLRVGGILYIEQGVPLFLTVSAYMAFMKMKTCGVEEYFSKSNFSKIIKRIFIPFFLFEIVIVCISLLRSNFNLKSFILSGGYGMGSYYPWLYFQFWLLLPFIYILLTKLGKNKWGAGICLIIMSGILELIFALVQLYASNELTDAIWRLFVGRYIFITYIAFLLVNNSFNLKRMFPLIIFGVIFSITHRYQLFSLQPWFYTTDGFSWNGVHWPMYFYSGFLFYILYNYLPKLPLRLKFYLQWVGHNSWEMFLSQMLYFSLFSMVNMPTTYKFINLSLFLLMGVVFSLITTLIYNGIKLKVINSVNFPNR